MWLREHRRDILRSGFCEHGSEEGFENGCHRSIGRPGQPARIREFSDLSFIRIACVSRDRAMSFVTNIVC